jgi:glycopeptide antibiotics resistance protein
MKFNRRHLKAAALFGYMAVVVLLTLRPFAGARIYESEYNFVLFESIDNYMRHMQNFGMINYGAFSYFPGNPILFLKNIFTISFINIWGNVALFVPLGVFMGMYFKKHKIKKALFGGLALSTAIETAQFIGLSSRRADIDDVVLNVTGSLAGVLLCILILKLSGGEAKGEN